MVRGIDHPDGVCGKGVGSSVHVPAFELPDYLRGASAPQRGAASRREGRSQVHLSPHGCQACRQRELQAPLTPRCRLLTALSPHL